MYKVYLKLLAAALVILVLLLPLLLLERLGRQQAVYGVVQFGYRLLAKVFGVQVRVKGELSAQRPLMLVSNHTSYLDIIAYGAVAPVVFTPKSDIAGWPFIGWLSRVLGCVFIERKATRTTDNMERLQKTLYGDRPVLLFAEGTTNDGRRLLPLKSSFFQLLKAGENPILVQPAVIRYVRMHGLPVDSRTMPMIAWYGDMALWPHVKTLFQAGPVGVEIEFLPPLNPADYEDRKAITKAVEGQLQLAFQGN